MRRTDFLALTGLSIADHHGMVRNGLFPFAARAGGRPFYCAQNVFLTCLMRELSGLVGGPEEARNRVLDLPQDYLAREWIELSDEALPDIWAASFRVTAMPRGSLWTVSANGWSIGRLSTIAIVDSNLEGRSLADYGDAVASVALVNLSSIKRTIDTRASVYGIELDTMIGQADEPIEADWHEAG